MKVKEAFDKATDWTHRRAYIKHLLIFLCISITGGLGGALYLTYLGKFGIYISSFLIVYVICNFAVLMGIIGSYIFRASWDNAQFLNVLPNIIPKMGKSRENNSDDNDDDSDEMSLEEMIRGR